jgi:hypothetical protein
MKKNNSVKSIEKPIMVIPYSSMKVFILSPLKCKIKNEAKNQVFLIYLIKLFSSYII